MAYEQRDGDIAIFAERDKKNDKAPDWKGTAIIDGVKYEVALWEKGNNGTMLAGNIKPAQRRDSNRGGGSSSSRGRDDGFSGGRGAVEDRTQGLDDDLPF